MNYLYSGFFSSCLSLPIVFMATMASSDSLSAEKEPAELVVDVKKVISNVERKPGGFLTCWLLDSDKNRPRKTPLVEVYKNLGVQSVRFPFGHLSNNYMWTSPPYDKAKEGLTPRVATMSKPPGSFSWSTNPDGTFKKDLDFDEFMEQCKDAKLEPVIVINVLSHKYEGGPTLDTLFESAVEWVRYSNITQKYGVKYWQLGNEQEHHSDEMSLDEYVKIYGRFAKAMKSVDPTIKTGVALISNRSWATKILKTHPELVDFIGCHQYQWSGWSIDAWKKKKSAMIPNVLGINRLLDEYSRSDIEIMVTEMSSFGKWFDGKGGAADMTRGLCFAEMLLHACSVSRVAYTHFWTTHNAWLGEDADGQLCSALDAENNPRTNGRIIGLVNLNLDDVMVETPRVVGHLRVFASCSKDQSQATVFIINKNNEPIEIALDVKEFSVKKVLSRTALVGKSYQDLNPQKIVDEKADVQGGKVTTTIPGISLSILKLEL